MVTNLSASHSIVSLWIREIRDIALQTDRARFRRNMERIGEVCAYEISKTLIYSNVRVQTPLALTTCATPEYPVLATILRAGAPLHQGLLNYFPDADCAFIGAYRKHHGGDSFSIHQHYVASPRLANRTLILADPMLATGSSIITALSALTENDPPAQVHIVAAIACIIGITEVLKYYPDAHIWAGAIDEELSPKKYIIPGLGDAGDLSFGEKKQC